MDEQKKKVLNSTLSCPFAISKMLSWVELDHFAPPTSVFIFAVQKINKVKDYWSNYVYGRGVKLYCIGGQN